MHETFFERHRRPIDQGSERELLIHAITILEVLVAQIDDLTAALVTASTKVDEAAGRVTAAVALVPAPVDLSGAIAAADEISVKADAIDPAPIVAAATPADTAPVADPAPVDPAPAA